MASEEAGKLAAREAEMQRDGYPAYTTSAGWLGYPDEKIVDILGKTLCKMSPRGHAAALALPLDARARALVAAAVTREAAALERLAAVACDT